MTTCLTQIGRLLIAPYMAQGLTQRGKAERLGISESLVSCDDRIEVSVWPAGASGCWEVRRSGSHAGRVVG